MERISPLIRCSERVNGDEVPIATYGEVGTFDFELVLWVSEFA